jgi:hypothetical protein
LKGEVRRGGAGDRVAQLLIADGAEDRGQVARQCPHRRHRACDARLGGAARDGGNADAEPQLAHVEPPLAHARADVIREQRELVRPHAGGDAQQENAVAQGEGLHAVGDAGADGLAPHALVDGRAGAGEAVLPGAVEDRFEALRVGEAVAFLGHAP